MSFSSRAVAALLGLSPVRSRRVRSELDLPVPMPDGSVLFADRWYPEDIESPPVVLVRSPYGRSGYMSMVGRIFAERGYQAVIQSCRGTAGSDGEFIPFRNEAVDGRATFAWLERQPWFSGKVATWGGSYLGLTQWASAADAPSYVKAMATSITASAAGAAIVNPGGAFALESTLRWASENSLPTVKGFRATKRQRDEMDARLKSAYSVLPLSAGDQSVVGRPVAFYQQWLEHDDPADPWWREADFSESVPSVAVPVSMVAGWYDMFLPYQLEDFAELQAAGRSPRITIGPWAHGDLGLFKPLFRDALEWFDARLLDKPAPPRKAVRLRLVGSGRWVEFDQWPPDGKQRTWYLDAGRSLGQDLPADSPPDAYRYDPADPTPGLGGPSLAPANKGPKDNRDREARPDVVLFTSRPSTGNTTFIGPLTAHLHFSSTSRHTDIHVTLCDVAPNGKSTNISSGIVRLRGVDTDPGTAVKVEMWPVGWTLRSGHRMRVQVSSGAHPTYARNPGTGEPLATAAVLHASDQLVYHDPQHPSRLEMREVAL